MSEMTNSNPKAANAVAQDIWFRGAHNQLSSGEICYFICQYLEERFPDSPEEQPYMFCTQRGAVADNPAEFCGMDCEHFGMCRTCRGFSAVRCQSCVTPREG